ncbi:putative cytochrome P450 [Rosa chinensis]|uniref:Putative cytochrome P450 n=1 Tax=Rosa chinensis TaxID=74649 RepID=A0A2P6R8A7_ROSCH|nr:putative cytochrome P450 [Rosa chinensis]
MEKIRSTADITQKASKGGHVQHDWAPSVHPFLHKWADEYGPVYMYSTGSQQHLVVSYPQLIRELRSHNSMDLGRPTYMNKNLPLNFSLTRLRYVYDSIYVL